MKKGLYSLVIASAVLGAASFAFAGAYGEAEQPEEIPAPAPAPEPPPEPEPPKVMRKHIGFFTDAETTRGLRAEIGSFYAAEYHPASVGDVEAANVYLNVSYGTELFEVGITAPSFIYAHQNGIPGDIKDVGDMRAWGKIIPYRSEHFDVGGGLVVRFPTGSGGAGTGEYGFEPFLTWAAHVGEADIRHSIGFDFYTEHPRLPEANNLDNNLAVLYPVAENVVLRGELTHNHFTDFDADPVSLFPGVDVTFPFETVDLVLRPTLGIGLHDAPDWQIGLGIALEVPGI